MYYWFTRFLVCAALIHAPSLVGGHPSYLILRAPATGANHRPTYERYPGQGVNVATQTYAYGWFGARPRPHWSRHFGYYRNYTEWSAK